MDYNALLNDLREVLMLIENGEAEEASDKLDFIIGEIQIQAARVTE